jgi:hypothetical protein
VTDSFWKTESTVPRRERVTWPSLAQTLRQLGIMVLVGILWAALFFGYLRLTGEPAEASLSDEPASVAAVATPTDVPTLQSADASAPTKVSATPTMSAPTPIPSTPPGPTLTATPELTTGEMLTPEPEPSATSTEAPAPSPTPTETLVLPTNTPVATEDTSTVSFAGDVSPILQRRCVKCHGGERTEEGLILRTYADAMAGSWNGPVIEPGSAEESFLVEQIVSGKMPKREPRLLPSEIQVISDWIDAGALDN